MNLYAKLKCIIQC